MWFGVDYYPEQWDSSLLTSDLDNIVELGCNVIRIGEFAWHKMEPVEGEYDFSYFDTVIALAKTRGLRVIMGTPTAAIPAWLAKKQPRIHSVAENGQPRAFGGRHVACYNQPILYEYAEKIIRAEVEHYRDEDAIVAWQIDNELGHEGSDLCYCEHCQQDFQRFLREKFRHDISRLNQAYGTTFWSQEYNGFDEIPTPLPTITTHNPALRLDWERFRSDVIERFAAFQTRLIKEIQPNAVVIHDFPGGGLDKHCDYSKVAQPLDIVAFNNYPVWGGQKQPLPPHEIAFELDYIRGLKQQNFWITEAIMGAQGHDVTGFLPRPNQAKLWSYQSLAHGCSSLLYFRYRGGTKGAEQFCYGILDPDNQKRRKYQEVQSLFAEAKAYIPQWESPIHPSVAMVYDYDSLAAFRIQRQSILLNCPSEMKAFYKPFYDANVPVDVIPETAGWFDGETGEPKYKVILLPLLLIGKNEMRAKVPLFVEQGGIVVLTYRSSVKDRNNNLTFGTVLPVGYASLIGAYVDETESLQERQAFPLVGCGEYSDHTGYGGVFRDMLVPTNANVLYRYDDPFYSEYAAITCRAHGKGLVYYVGCSPDPATLDTLMYRILQQAGIPSEESADGVEIVYRGSGSDRIRIVMNHNENFAWDGGTQYQPFGCQIEPAPETKLTFEIKIPVETEPMAPMAEPESAPETESGIARKSK